MKKVHLKPVKKDDVVFDVIAEDNYGQAVIRHPEGGRLYIVQKSQLVEVYLEPPCESCDYDGQYRCETCKENDYEGFNIKNYPRTD